MIRKVLVLIGKSQYDSKLHFSTKLSEAFKRKGIETAFFNVLQPHPKKELEALILRENPDLCCTFYPLNCMELIVPAFWERHHIPFIVLLIDPSPDWATVPCGPWMYYACCDEYQCDFMRKHGVSNVFFWGHGVERDIAVERDQNRPFDVVFLGSSYDPVGWREYWKTFPVPIQKALEQAAERYLSDADMPFWEAVDTVLQEQGEQTENKALFDYYFRMMIYAHALDRVELIRAVQEARVDVYGGAVFRHPKETKGWHYYLADKKNIHIHPSISLEEGIEVMKKSKICLNSMPYFKNGTHERLFTAAACGCLVITTDTKWVREHFTPGHDLLLYTPFQWDAVNEQINYYLNHESERQDIAWNGRQKVMQVHTWDHRVEELLERLV